MRRAFEAVAVEVEGAKEALLAGVPGPRREPAPLADALSVFERRLRVARDAMDGWRDPGVEEVWVRCRDGVEEASRRAERLRLEAPDMDFESMVLLLGDLIAPLDVFAEADRALGTRGR